MSDSAHELLFLGKVGTLVVKGIQRSRFALACVLGGVAQTLLSRDKGIVAFSVRISNEKAGAALRRISRSSSYMAKAKASMTL